MDAVGVAHLKNCCKVFADLLIVLFQGEASVLIGEQKENRSGRVGETEVEEKEQEEEEKGHETSKMNISYLVEVNLTISPN